MEKNLIAQVDAGVIFYFDAFTMTPDFIQFSMVSKFYSFTNCLAKIVFV